MSIDSETFYSIEPNLEERHRAELLNFLRQRGYEFSHTSGDLIELGCKLARARRGESGEATNALGLSISMEDTLSKSIPLTDAAGKLRRLLKGLSPANSITIIDPYIFPDRHDVDYVNFLLDVFSETFDAVHEINFISHPACTCEVLRDDVARVILKRHNMTVKNYTSSDFHDRLWIIDNDRGIYCGNSLNGIGKKFSLVAGIEAADIQEINKMIECILR